MDNDREDMGGGLAVFVCLMVLLVMGGLWWERFEEPVVRTILELSGALMTPAGLASEKYARAARMLAQIDPADKDMTFALAVLGKALFPYVLFVCLPVLALLVVLGWRANVLDACRRTLGIESLLENVRETAPCIEPVLNWPRCLLDEPLDSGPWMAARQPLQFAAEHGLLLRKEDNRKVRVDKAELLTPDGLLAGDCPWFGRTRNGLALDREAAVVCYQGLMGPKWEGFEGLSPTLRKLAFAFVLFGSGEKESAQKLLDELSLSFRVVENGSPRKRGRLHLPGKKGRRRQTRAQNPGEETPRYTLDTSVDPALLSKIEKALHTSRLQGLVRQHGVWTNMVLLAIYEDARRKGVLPTAEFIWLKPVNRTLFYLLNNVGRRTAWPEIAGPWAHYQAERSIALLDPESKGIAVPLVVEGVNALEVALYEEGWITPDMLSHTVAVSNRNLGID